MTAADELGYASGSTAWRHVQGALANHATESVTELKELAGSRLEALLAACWGKAREGDLAAVRTCLSVVLAEIKLYGLVRGVVRCTQPQTVVLMENDCRLRGCPQHA